jgi:hypothetical protein
MIWQCPCCGAAHAARVDPAVIVAGIPLSALRRRLCEILLAQFGTFVATERLAAAMYADDPNGGPDDAAGVARQLVYKLRPGLLARGLALESANDAGYRMCWADGAVKRRGRVAVPGREATLREQRTPEAKPPRAGQPQARPGQDERAGE